MGREGKAELVERGTGSTGHAGVEAEGEVVDEIAIVGGFPASQVAVSEEEGGPGRPSEVVHDHSQFGWSHQSVWIDRLKLDFRTGRV